MKRKQEIEVRLSEIREAVNAPEEPDNMAELRAEYVKLEKEWRSLAEAEGETADEPAETEDAEQRELRELEAKVEFRNYLTAAANNRHVSGAEKELNEALQVRSAGGVVVPWEALLPQDADVEERQDAVTPAPAVYGRMQRPIIPRVFATGIANFLGIGMPTVGVGEQVYTYLSAGADAEIKAKDAEVDADAATFTPKQFNPLRLTARYLFRVEDTAALAGMEPALRGDLRMALQEKMDSEIVNGAGGADEIKGLLAVAANGGLADVADPAAVVNAARLVDTYAALVDGRYAKAQADIRMAIGAATFAKVASLTLGDAWAFDRYAAQTRVEALLPAAAANVQQAIAAKTRAPGLYAVAPVWQGVELIRDPYTNAAKGQIALTAVALWNFGIVRPNGFVRVKFKLA